MHDVKLQVTLKINGIGPNLDKRSVWLSDPAPSHEILTKRFCCRTFRRRFETGDGEILSALSFGKKWPFLLIPDAALIF